MKILTCAIVEDSNVHRVLLERAIEKNPHLQLNLSYNDSVKALKELNRSNIDVLFIDIEMPVLNGFDFIDRLKINTQIIIISQNPNYALKAFDFCVTDFLLKPISKSRFDIAVQKVLEKVKPNRKETVKNTLIVKHNLKQVELNLNDILWVEALGDYVKVVTPQHNYIILSTLSGFEQKLKQYYFLRIHKSYIVNLKMVERYNHQFIEIKDKKLPISRTKNVELDKLLNYLN